MGTLRCFGEKKDGNVALLTAIMLLPIIAVMGGAIDVITATSATKRLQSALDAGALAAASLTNSQTVETTIEEYIRANIPPGELTDNLEINIGEATVGLNARVISVTASSSIESNFLKLLGIGEMDIAVETVATQSATNVELSLVLDISSSMRGTKVANLQTAAESFINQVLNDENISRTSINLVPFGGTVNIGDLFDTHATPLGSAVVNPSEAQYDVGDDLLEEDFRFSDGDQCIEYVAGDFDTGLIPANSRPQVPHFWKWNNFNPWCPLSASAMILNSNDRDALIDRIQEFQLSDGTGMDIGAMWGAKALNPAWRGSVGGDFSQRPSDFEEATLKVFVLMTDGGITAQFRPEDYSLFNTHTNRSNNRDPWTNNGGNSGNNNNQQTVVSRGSAGNSSTTDTAIGYFKRICDDLHADNVVVYTIGFQIGENSLPDQMLQYCTSTPSNYYFVEGLNIEAAFNSIAASVNSLRVIG